MDEKEITGRALKVIEPGVTEFVANGKKYLIEKRIGQRRYRLYLAAQIELGLGIGFQEIFDIASNIYEATNKQRINDIAVLSRDLMQGVANEIDNRTPAIITLCACFINEVNEDRRVLTDVMIKQKESDWMEEGIDMESFFSLALSFIPGFIRVYKEVSQNTLKEPKEPEN